MDIFLLDIQGKDSKRYLNSRLTNDINKLIGCQPSFMLSPQGKIEGQFYVYAFNDGYLLFAVGEQEQILQSFKKYLVADRVTVKKLDLNLQNTSHGESLLVYKENSVRLSNNLLGTDLIFEFGAGDPILPDLDQRFKSAKPIYPLDLKDLLFPEIGENEAVAFNKGCYVGQEVVERVSAIGKVPSVLKRVDFHQPIEIKTRFYGADSKLVGEVISTDKSGMKTFSRVKSSYAEVSVSAENNQGIIL